MPIEPEWPDLESRKKAEAKKKRAAIRSAATWAMLNAVAGAYFVAGHHRTLAMIAWVCIAVEMIRLVVLTWDHDEEG